MRAQDEKVTQPFPEAEKVRGIWKMDEAGRRAALREVFAAHIERQAAQGLSGDSSMNTLHNYKGQSILLEGDDIAG